MDRYNFRPTNLFLENTTDQIRRPSVDVGEFLPSFDNGIIESNGGIRVGDHLRFTDHNTR